jgi:hypothetical protein
MTQSSTCPGSLVANVSMPTRTLSFGGNHLNDLAPPSDIGGKSCHLVRHLPQLRLGRLGEVGNYRRIDQVGLSPLASEKRQGTISRAGRSSVKGDAKRGQVQSLKHCTYNIYLFVVQKPPFATV